MKPTSANRANLTPGRLHPGGLEFWHREGESLKDFVERQDRAIETERKRLQEFFRNEIPDWARKDGYHWDQKCPACDMRGKLAAKGFSPKKIEEILNFEDAADLKPGDRRGSRNTNILLSAAGLANGPALRSSSLAWATGRKLGQIGAAIERDEAIGGKKVGAGTQRINLDTGERNKGTHRRDSYDSPKDDASGGSQTNSKEPDYLGERTLKQLGLTQKQVKEDFRLALEDDVRTALQGEAGFAALPAAEFDAG